jgi:glycosyltransferase involved in cell wall biosynthesis
MVYNGINPAHFFISKEDKAVNAKKTIGIIGRLAAVKDHKNLINAFKLAREKLKNIELMIVGDGPLKQELESYVQEMGLAESVVFTGARRDIAQLLSGFDIFILSSLDEGMPITLLEAMAAGVPVIATKVGGIPEIVVDGKTGFLVPPQAPDKLAEKIYLLLENGKLADLMGKEGRKSVDENFSIGKMVSKYEAIYLAALKNG